MLIQHTLIYFFSRGVPSLIGFVAVVIYTRLLSPESFGKYSLVLAAAVLVNAILYQWLSASLVRFFPRYRTNEIVLYSAISLGFLAASLVVGVISCALFMLWGLSAWGEYILVGTLLAWGQAWFTIDLEIVRSHLAPIRYGFYSTIKAVVAIVVGIVLVLYGYDAHGALIGMLIGFSLPALAISWRGIGVIRQFKVDKKLVMELLRYGLPLTASFSLGVIISTSDRFMIAWLVSESEAGLYAASQGLAQQAVISLMTMIHLAAFPLILRTLEDFGEDAARVLLIRNVVLLLLVGLPVTVWFIALSHFIAAAFLGAEFREAGVVLMPWIAVSTLIWCLRAYYFDLAFYLGKQTNSQFKIMVVAAVLNIILNYVLIPSYGALGAVYASIAAQSMAMVFSVIFGRRVFRLPSIGAALSRLLIASGVMAVTLVLGSNIGGVFWFVIISLIGSIFYGVVVYMLNPADIKKFVLGAVFNR